jgi:hypothetical protein
LRARCRDRPSAIPDVGVETLVVAESVDQRQRLRGDAIVTSADAARV